MQRLFRDVFQRWNSDRKYWRQADAEFNKRDCIRFPPFDVPDDDDVYRLNAFVQEPPTYKYLQRQMWEIHAFLGQFPTPLNVWTAVYHWMKHIIQNPRSCTYVL